MIILPVDGELLDYLKKRNLTKKFEKQKAFFEEDAFYPGLGTELLEPRHEHLWSFRIDRKYRAIFIFHNRETIEIVDINNHYR